MRTRPKIKSTAEVCESCGRPRAGHRYRHQFKPLVPKGNVFAFKARETPHNAWMPKECYARLEADPDPSPKAWFLQVCGWSTEPDEPGWPVPRLERCLPTLVKQWEQEYGKGWKLEIR